MNPITNKIHFFIFLIVVFGATAVIMWQYFLFEKEYQRLWGESAASEINRSPASVR